MSKKMFGIATGSLLLLLAGSAFETALAAEFDGSKPLVCAMINAFECGPDTGCEGGTPESNGLSRFLRIDFGSKEVYTTKEDQARASKIEKVDRADGVILLNGVQSGRKWSMALTEATGYMVLTVAGDQEAFVIFGACTPP
ncbi:MAG: hypothetical protein AB1640_04095 [bacterium]